MSEQGEGRSAIDKAREVGAELRFAREAKGLPLAEIATRLNLKPEQLTALEAGELAERVPQTFVTGYLRAYCRILGLNERADELIARYGTDITTTPLKKSVATARQPTSGDLSVKLMSVAVVVVIASLAVWSVVNRGGDEVAEVAPAQPLLPAPAATAAVEPALPLTTEEEGGASDAAAPAVPASDTPPPAEAGSSAEAVPPAPLEQEPAGSEAETVQLEEVPPALSDAIPQAMLSLQLDEESWVEILDAQGRKLTYRLLPAGQEYQFHGEAPFKLFFGYAPGVRLYYNGVLFDHSRFHRNEIARFRIGRPEDNQLLSR